ncbi:MAG: hypothetical protein EA352_12005 [Gemmatimonadales bacterium]|nr:MAG: hypothetical protein EA352_12005 [Gemmatimonadales bacterium]
MTLLALLLALATGGCDHTPPPPAAEAGPQLVENLDGTCQVRVVPTGLMIRAREEGIPDPGPMVARSMEGVYFTNAAYERGVVLAWDEEGDFLARVGGLGEGPEEFGAIATLRPGSEGGVHVINGAGQWSHIDADLSVRTLGSHPGLIHASRSNVALLSDTVVVVVETLSQGQPSRGAVLAWTEDRIEVVGEFETGHDEEASWMAAMAGVASLGQEDSFWTGPWITGEGTYRLEERGLDGRLLRSLDRSHPWDLPGPRPGGDGLAAVRVESLSPGVALLGVTVPPRRPGVGDSRAYYEILDTRGEERLAIGTRRGDAWAPRLAFTGVVPEYESTGMVYSYHRHIEAGLPSILVSELFLEEPGSEEGEAACRAVPGA